MIRRSTMVVVALCVCAVSFSVVAQDQKASDKDKTAAPKPDAAPVSKEKSDEKPEAKDKPVSGDMESWMKLAAAGEQHKKLDSLAGTWNLSIRFAEAGSAESRGKAEFKWIMDGRFLVESAKTDMGGMAFEWMGWHGYDNQKKHYVSAWVDNFGTSIEVMTGRWDEAKKTLTYVGETDDPSMGGKKTVKWIMHLENKDRFTTQMLEGTGNGHDKKVMEIVGTRT